MSLWLSPFRANRFVRPNRPIEKPRLNLEALESREVPAQYLVTGIGDVSGLNPTAGTGTTSNPFRVDSLRSAIELANASTGKADTIRFDDELANATITLNPSNAPLTFKRGAKTIVDGTDRNIAVNGNGFLRLQRVVNIETGAKADIKNLTIENGVDGFDSPRSAMAADPLTDSGGGGIFNAGRLLLANVFVLENVSLQSDGGGGGIFNAVGATLTLNDSTVADNQASSSFFSGPLDGGGILNAGKLTIARTTLRNNTASGSGGGIANFGSLSITASTISENRTQGFEQGSESRGESSVTGGGGIFNDGTLSMTNATISGNYTLFAGGGLCIGESGSSTLRNCTLTENGAGSGGGIFVGLINPGEYVRLRSTIVSGNYNSDESPNDIATFGLEGSSKIPISATYCLIGTFTPDSFSGTGNLINIDAMLSPLQDNGGPTLTHLPLSGSPVINKGSPSAAGLPRYDQRGQSEFRVRGGRVDIGAVEVQEGSFPGGGMSPPPATGGDRRYH